MPRGDGTGPAAMGPMTGRAAGHCAGYGVPGYMNPVGGRGFYGRGLRGGGRGWRNWHYATGAPGWARAARGWPAWGGGRGYAPPVAPPVGAYAPSPQQEAAALKDEAEFLKSQLEEIQARLSELEKEGGQ